MNIKQRMTELVQYFKKNKLNDVTIYVRPECNKEWHEEYAIVQDLYYDDWAQGEYFDHHRIQEDIIKFIKEWFGVDKHYSEYSRGIEKPKEGELVLRFYWQSQEFEAYYQGCKCLRKFKNPNDGKRGALLKLPDSTLVIARQLNNQTMDLNDALNLIEKSSKNIKFSIEEGVIKGELSFTDKTHYWNIIEFDDAPTNFLKK